MRSTQAGVSFLAVLFAVALVGLSLAGAGRLVGHQLRRDKEMELLSIGRQYRAAIQSYRVATPGGGPGDFPRSLDDLLRDSRPSMPARHLRQRFLDPMTGRDWILVRLGDRIVGVRSASELEPLRSVGFEGAELGFNNAGRYADWVFMPPDAPPVPLEPGKR